LVLFVSRESHGLRRTIPGGAAIPNSSNPQAAAVGDFNGDGNQDLAIANSTSNTISVLLGKGDGTFSPRWITQTGTAPQGIAVGDFNGDGHLDIAVTNSDSNTVSIFLAMAMVPSSQSGLMPRATKPQGIAVGDFRR